MRLAQDTIKALAANKGWTISELLERAGVSRNAYYSLARKDSVLPSSLGALAEALETSPGAFLTEEDAPIDQLSRALHDGGVGPLGDTELGFLHALVDEQVDFMLVGPAAAALQGAQVEVKTVDLWLADLSRRSGLDRALQKVGGTYLPPDGTRPPTLAGDAVRLIRIVSHVDYLGEFARERQRAVMIDLGGVEVPVPPLDRVIADPIPSYCAEVL